ncbi:MAG TPA: hypothetical protein VF220_07685 [Nitrososphaeraceae archaeon]
MKKSVISAIGLLAITIAALATTIIASLAVGTTIQAQAKSPNANSQFIDNRHSHTSIGDEIGEIKGNEAVVQNTDESHTNTNFNYNRGETFEERYKENTHDKPNTGGNSDNGDETEP